MRAEIDAVELDILLERYVDALNTCKDLPPAIPGRYRDGTGADLLTAWVVSTEGRRRIKAMLLALRAERRALEALAEFARLQVETAPAPQAGGRPAETEAAVA